MSDIQSDVLIIGAGPVGLTLANELTRRGIKHRLVDMAPSIREVSKAMILHVRTREILDKVGIGDRLSAEARPMTEVVVHAYGKHIGGWKLDDIEGPYAHPVIIGQNRTQHVLLDNLTALGGGVDWNTEATAVDTDGDGATIVLKTDSGEETHRCRYVIGCEGSNSLVRKAMKASFEGERYSGEQFIQADCQIRWSLPKGRSYLFLTEDGYLMVIELPGDLVRVFISLPDAAAGGAFSADGQLGAVEAVTEEPTLEEVRRHLARLSGFSCELTNPVWLARYRTSHRYADTFSKGRAFIAGDAGHVHVPIGGQGMNTGIQDAFNLGWKLAGVVDGSLKETVLDSYQAERHPVAEGLIKGTNLAYRGILHPSEARQRAVRMFGPYIVRNPLAQTFMRDTLEELKVFYPASPLNLDLGGASGPRPGERVLDSTLVRASDRQTVTINEMTRSSKFSLLLFGGVKEEGSLDDLWRLAATVEERHGAVVQTSVILVDPEASSGATASAEVMLDALHLAHAVYGLQRSAFYLLRPDTYVAARGPIARGEDLLDYLGTLLVAQH